jgi:hypothetical protein
MDPAVSGERGGDGIVGGVPAGQDRAPLLVEEAAEQPLVGCGAGQGRVAGRVAERDDQQARVGGGRFVRGDLRSLLTQICHPDAPMG